MCVCVWVCARTCVLNSVCVCVSASVCVRFSGTTETLFMYFQKGYLACTINGRNQLIEVHAHAHIHRYSIHNTHSPR